METYKQIDLGESDAASYEPQERENTGGVFESTSHHLNIKCTLLSKGKGAFGGNLALPMIQSPRAVAMSALPNSALYLIQSQLKSPWVY